MRARPESAGSRQPSEVPEESVTGRARQVLMDCWLGRDWVSGEQEGVNFDKVFEVLIQ